MGDLLYYAKKPEVQELLQKRRSLWRSLERSKQKSKIKSSRKLIRLLQTNDPYAEAMVRDFIEITTRNFKSQLSNIPQLSELKLHEIVDTGFYQSNKLDLMTKYPAWKPTLENPQIGIKAFMDQKDFHTLRSILDAIVDEEFIQQAVQLLVDLGPQERDLQKEIDSTLGSLVDKTSSSSDAAATLHTVILIEQGFRKKNSVHLKEVLKKLIDKGNFDILSRLHSVFSMPHAIKWKNEEKIFRKKILDLIEKMSIKTLGAYGTFLGSEVYHDWGPERKAILKRIHTVLKDQSDHPEAPYVLGILNQKYAQNLASEEKNIRKLIFSSVEPLDVYQVSILISLLSKDYSSTWKLEKDLLNEKLSTLIDETDDLLLLADIAKAFAEAGVHLWTVPFSKVKLRIKHICNSGDFQNAMIFFSVFSGPGAAQWKDELIDVLNSGLYSVVEVARSVFQDDANLSWDEGEEIVSKYLDPFLETASLNEIDSLKYLFKNNKSRKINEKTAIFRKRIRFFIDQAEYYYLNIFADLLIEIPAAKGWEQESEVLRSKFKIFLKNETVEWVALVRVLKNFQNAPEWKQEKELFYLEFRKAIEQSDAFQLEKLSSVFHYLSEINLTSELGMFRIHYNKLLKEVNNSSTVGILASILTNPIHSFSQFWIEERQILQDQLPLWIGQLKHPTGVCDVLSFLEISGLSRSSTELQLLRIQMNELMPRLKWDYEFKCYASVFSKLGSLKWNTELIQFRKQFSEYLISGRINSIYTLTSLFLSSPILQSWPEELDLFRRRVGVEIRKTTSLSEMIQFSFPLQQNFAKNWVQEKGMNRTQLLKVMPQAPLVSIVSMISIYNFNTPPELQPILAILKRARSIHDDSARQKKIIEMIAELEAGTLAE